MPILKLGWPPLGLRQGQLQQVLLIRWLPALLEQGPELTGLKQPVPLEPEHQPRPQQALLLQALPARP